MPGETVLCSVAKGVALVTLNNPPLNLVTLGMTRELGTLPGVYMGVKFAAQLGNLLANLIEFAG